MTLTLRTLREARLALEPAIRAGAACQRCGQTMATTIGVVTADTPELLAEVSAALGEPCRAMTLWVFAGCGECARPATTKQKLFVDFVEMLEEKQLQ